LNKKNFRSYKDAKKWASSLKITWVKWQKLCKENKIPSDIPRDPAKSYKNKGWTSWGDFSGTGYVAQTKRSYRSFLKAREYSRSLNLRSRKDWDKFCSSGKIPKDIPLYPNQTYEKKGWNGLGDWLGTGRIANMRMEFLPFEKAKKLVKELSLKSGFEYRSLAKSGKLPKGIPNDPSKSYKKNGWTSWGDFLGTGYVAQQNRNYLPFSEAKKIYRQIAKKNKIRNVSEWTKYLKTHELPTQIPRWPYDYYSKEKVFKRMKKK